MNREALLAEMKSRLAGAFGPRLQGVVLYGSAARGDAGADSDIDLLVLLAGPIDAWPDIRAAVGALYELEGEIGRHIHVAPADIADYRAARFALYRNAQREGIFA